MTVKRCILILLMILLPGGTLAEQTDAASLGYFNDQLRTYAGRGCQSSGYFMNPCPEYYGSDSCWAWGEGWLWIFPGAEGISRIRFGVEFGYDSHIRDGCCESIIEWNESVISDLRITPLLCHPSLERHVEQYDILFHGCRDEVVWLQRLRCFRPDGWNIKIIPYFQEDPLETVPRAVPCGQDTTMLQALIISHYRLEPVQPDQWQGEIETESSPATWGSIKAMFE
ncbi:MAG: hypothetical protein JXB45_01425 [Candidatus Krumholzibacteriota bacterium]|nr:hypothetical protein [Candidatus Krumholzibacteriota bacterium]